MSGETSDALNVQVDMFDMKQSMCFDICMGKPSKQGFQFQGIEVCWLTVGMIAVGTVPSCANIMTRRKMNIINDKKKELCEVGKAEKGHTSEKFVSTVHSCM